MLNARIACSKKSRLHTYIEAAKRPRLHRYIEVYTISVRVGKVWYDTVDSNSKSGITLWVERRRHAVEGCGRRSMTTSVHTRRHQWAQGQWGRRVLALAAPVVVGMGVVHDVEKAGETVRADATAAATEVSPCTLPTPQTTGTVNASISVLRIQKVS